MDSYIIRLKKLLSYHNLDNPKLITDEHIAEYLDFMITRKNYANKTIHQAAHSFSTIFNIILKMNLNVSIKQLPKRSSEKAESLDPIEVLEILNSTPDEKYHLIFSLIYSAGLHIKEVQYIRPKDIDFSNHLLHITQKSRSSRKAILSKFLSKKLKPYHEIHKNQKYLFEGNKTNHVIDSSGIQKAFKKSLRAAGITKEVSPRSLRYSFVRHLVEQGIPLRVVLDHLGMRSKILSRTYYHYTVMIDKDIKVDYSPLDRIVTDDDSQIDMSSIEKMLFKINHPEIKDYIIESIHCINSGLHRASVIFIWSAAVYIIREKCLKHSSNILNKAIKKYQSSAPNIKRIEDFSYIKDSNLLEVSRELNIFDKDEKNVLQECLNLRNKCSHPSSYKPKPIKVKAYLEDIVSIVLSQ